MEIWNGQGRPEITNFTISAVETGKYYSFRHRAFNFNGASSEYSDILTTYACVLPTKPSTPTWVTSTTTLITIVWDEPYDDGGCPINEYVVLRDSGAGLGLVDVTTEVHSDLLAGKPYINGLDVTDFPESSLGNRFVFVVVVFTDFAVDGV